MVRHFVKSCSIKNSNIFVQVKKLLHKSWICHGGGAAGHCQDPTPFLCPIWVEAGTPSWLAAMKTLLEAVLMTSG